MYKDDSTGLSYLWSQLADSADLGLPEMVVSSYQGVRLKGHGLGLSITSSATKSKYQPHPSEIAILRWLEGKLCKYGEGRPSYYYYCYIYYTGHHPCRPDPRYETESIATQHNRQCPCTDYLRPHKAKKHSEWSASMHTYIPPLVEASRTIFRVDPDLNPPSFHQHAILCAKQGHDLWSGWNEFFFSF